MPSKDLYEGTGDYPPTQAGVQSWGPCYLGVDPGSNGGLALLDQYGMVIDLQSTSKLTLPQLFDWFGDRFCRYRNQGPPVEVYAVLEKVSGYIAGGKAPNADGSPAREVTRGSQMFAFGASFGGLRMALVACGVPYQEVSPRTWQAEFELKKEKGETQTRWKGRLKGHAQRILTVNYNKADRHPLVLRGSRPLNVTLATSDAILLAEYARRTRALS